MYILLRNIIFFGGLCRTFNQNQGISMVSTTFYAFYIHNVSIKCRLYISQAITFLFTKRFQHPFPPHIAEHDNSHIYKELSLLSSSS